jgi:DNA-binding transcriptional regulator YiaG
MPKQTGVRNRSPHRFSDSEIRRMVERRAEGVTLEDISRMMGTSTSTVRKIIRAAQATASGGGAGAPMDGR